MKGNRQLCQMQKLSAQHIQIIIIQIMKQGSTESQQKIQMQIQQIYQTLIKFGFPGLVASSIIYQVDIIEKNMADYFQPNIKRQNLIQWLILNINTLYAQEVEVKGSKKRKIMNNLWRIGVMPFSKHTSNLDYQKYVDGLLGYQNSINLIYNLCVMLKDSKQLSKSKQDQKFGHFLQQIMTNYDSLVNADYDPYKISFPPAYQNLSDQQFQIQYKQIAQKIYVSVNKIEEQQKEKKYVGDFEQICKQFEDKKDQFNKKYQQFVIKIKKAINDNSILIQNWKQADMCENRTLKISPNLSKVYRQYKQKIKLKKLTLSRLGEERQIINTLIDSLNETVCL